MNIDIDHLKQWIGKTESYRDIVGATPIRALSATLDREDIDPKKGDALPAGWHWLYFLPLPRHSEIGPDGHPLRGGFLPPVSLPRRMWAGSQLEFIRPLQVGDAITKSSQVEDVRLKVGRTGPLVFVRVRHETSNVAGVAVVEVQSIVYRDHPTSGEKASAPKPPSVDHEWVREIRPDEVLLFRYSALTFNSHRIHYDREYATHVEGYSGLVVHGPLVATMLLDLLWREFPQARLRRFEFRALSPLFDTDPFFVCGRRNDGGHTISLWAKSHDGHIAMEAIATLA